MQKWHFKISGKINISGDKTVMEIKPENFMTLIRISDYQNSNMPTIMARLNIDKNLFDKIIKNAKTATIYLKIEKFNKQEEVVNNPIYETVLDDEFSIFVSNDINYNKELDYIESENNPSETPRKDVYIETYIGLISKKCINANKVISNNTVLDTPMMNIVASYLKNLHLLLEPFNYNKNQIQLVIPPKDTLSELIKYFNSVNVFYDTKYMFFIDEPYCSYLISRSGNGIERSDEKYNTVYFNIHKSNDKSAAIEGMMEDQNNLQYYIDINVLDTKYTIDHDTAKIIDKLQTIINPNNDNTINCLNDIQNAIAKIQSYMLSLETKVKNSIVDFGDNLNEQLSNIKIDVDHSVLDTLDVLKGEESETLNKYIDSILSIPTSVDVKDGDSTITVDIVSDAVKKAAQDLLNNTFNDFTKNLNSLVNSTDLFKLVNEDSENVAYQMNDVRNEMSSVTAVNAQDVSSKTKKKVLQLNINASNLVNKFSSQILPNKSIANTLANNAMQLTNGAIEFYQKLQAVQTGGYGHLLPSDLTSSFDKNKEIADQFSTHYESIFSETSTINKNLDKYMDIANKINSSTKNLTSITSDLDKISKLNLKGKFGSVVNDSRTLVGNVTNIFDKFNNTIQDSISYADVILGGFDLNQISDLTGVGKLGLSNIETILKVGATIGSGILGTKIIKTKNDNPNELKNIKSEVETMINKLTINKYELDPSIFTPNKKYKIKNYDAHSDKDGLFILNKKTEIYVREDNTFNCNTVLDLAKVPDSTNTNQVQDTSSPNTNNTTQEDWYKKSTGQEEIKSNENINVNNNGTGNITIKGETYKIDKSKVIGIGSIYDLLK